jgi:ubiquinol-cytochrome c reductase cytochrome b subunit
MYCFLVLVLTGTYLSLFFEASTKEVLYHGSYHPLDGVKMSAAYQSVINLSFDVRAGLVMRQVHHWAALVFVAAIVVHLCRVFFTGAFRKPRELNWMIGVTMLILVLANGFAGYSLLDDLLSGTGLRIAYAIVESIPVVGTWLASLVWGGEYPGTAIIHRLFVLHVFVVPGAIAVLLAGHLALIWHQKHTQFPGPGRTEHNVVGSRMFPSYATKSISLFFGVFAVLCLLGGLFQINPVWFWGPYHPEKVAIVAQPDWYVGWLEGALRIMPPWEIRAGGYMVPNPFFPGVLLPGLTFVALYLYPFIERRFTRDQAFHHLLDRPRFHPVRTALGVSVLTFYTLVFLAGSDDVMAAKFHVSYNAIVWFLRFAIFVLPAVSGAVALFWCRGLAAGTREAVHGETPTGVAEELPPSHAASRG